MGVLGEILEEAGAGAVSEGVTVADFVAAYTLDWANEVHLLDAFPGLRAYMDRMYARPKAPPRIAAAFASIRNA